MGKKMEDHKVVTKAYEVYQLLGLVLPKNLSTLSNSGALSKLIIDEQGRALCFRQTKPRSYAEAARILNISKYKLIKILTIAANGGLDSLIST